MNSKKKQIIKKLKSLVRSAEKFTADLNELILMLESEVEDTQITDKKTVNKKKSLTTEDLSISKLKNKSRDEALEVLESATQKQLSQLFRELGGSSRDARKKKEFLIERILWNLYDFEEGHSILKETKK